MDSPDKVSLGNVDRSDKYPGLDCYYDCECYEREPDDQRKEPSKSNSA